MPTEKIKLTEYSHGSGCGCKISPAILDQMLQTQQVIIPDPHLLVGNASRDDAAVYDLGNGTSVISTTDFFMPIVNDAFEFGRIAACNAISDIYAMGGRPLMAIAIFGWPVDKLGPEIARQVIDGGRACCSDAGIPLAGGHSIDSPEPIFGLAVTGIVENKYLKQNNQARENSLLYLTKPLGIGILTTATKQGKLKPEHIRLAPETMSRLNSIGSEIGRIDGVSAMTDVTGFGLLGHLLEICQGSGVSAKINYDAVPKLDALEMYLDLGCSPGGAQRNFDSYAQHLGTMTETQRKILCDPQTSGGLLVAVDPESTEEFIQLTQSSGLDLKPIGRLVTSDNGPVIQIDNQA